MVFCTGFACERWPKVVHFVTHCMQERTLPVHVRTVNVFFFCMCPLWIIINIPIRVCERWKLHVVPDEVI